MTDADKKAARKAARKRYYRYRRDRRIAEGMCSKCGAERDRTDRLQCAKCREESPKGVKARYWEMRMAVFAHYGQFCQCCGETEPLFLAIDHGPGAPSKKDNPEQNKVANLTKWVFDNGFPKGFRIMCHNCNMAVRYDRECPHQRFMNDALDEVKWDEWQESEGPSPSSAPLPLT